MTCDEKVIAPWQVLIKGTLLKQGESFTKNGYRKYAMRILGGPGNYQQYFECEVKTADESKHKGVADGTEVEALCWANGRLWNDAVFTNLTLIHLAVAEQVAPAEAVADDDDDLSFGDELPF